ncbi:DUF7164 domain-containing protein [Paraburkholderia tuberum]|uniref:DUF7164 domain-containing protein n=1 Tax=Paraburkholderia tuberum TaxID=157910 RepID=A0A1H1K0G7_9BURK|nr:hypothetical protein [Paraburkholderia tuberum]SDR55562.1 hypothetical protein SAMN05445850_6105 [Paraburkholderia tuberum]
MENNYNANAESRSDLSCSEASIDLGVLVYIDNRKETVEEFHWLYKSMIFSNLFLRSRIIAVCHPDAINLLPVDEKLTIIPSTPYLERNAEWQGYAYINSVGNFVDQSVFDECKKYRFILKTDCDTFVTPALLDFSPSGLCFGFGAYAYEEEVRGKLSQCSLRWGFPHSGLHNVGASVLGPSDHVCNFLTAQLDYCNKLIKEEFSNFEGAWPGWCKNVLTMYAGELALRCTYPQQCSLGFLDHFPSATRNIGSDVLHIHAWHTNQYWSKHDFRAGKYFDIRSDQIDRNTLGGYCHWLAQSAIDNVVNERHTR